MSQRFYIRIGFFLAGLLLLLHWLVVASAWANGRMFAYANFWHAPVGTITGIIALSVLTPTFLWALVNYWNWIGDRPWRN